MCGRLLSWVLAGSSGACHHINQDLNRCTRGVDAIVFCHVIARVKHVRYPLWLASFVLVRSHGPGHRVVVCTPSIPTRPARSSVRPVAAATQRGCRRQCPSVGSPAYVRECVVGREQGCRNDRLNWVRVTLLLCIPPVLYIPATRQHLVMHLGTYWRRLRVG